MRRFSGDKFLKKINKKARRGYRGEPIATISYYGPDDKKATKVAVGIVYSDKKDVQMHRWFNEDLDVRRDPAINKAIFHLPAWRSLPAMSLLGWPGAVDRPHSADAQRA
jgi:hypothetical protein